MMTQNSQKEFSFWLKWKRRLRYLCITLFLVVCALVAIRFYPHPPLKDLAPYSRMVSDEKGVLLRMTLAADEHYRLWVPLEEISPSVVDSILLKEDRQFYSHLGINFSSIARAALSTYIQGNRQGGSTISMQLARRVYDINSKTLTGKAYQIMMALWLEARYSKHDILETYLNLVPMGGNIEGVEAASQVYFHKSATQLTLMESLALAVIPQRPVQRAYFGEDLQKAHTRLMQDWQAYYPDDPRTRSLLDLPVNAYQRKDLPLIAPHYTDYLLAHYSDTHVQGTLNTVLQKEIEQLVEQYIHIHQNKGIENTAVLLVDTRDLSVKSMVGSANYHSTEIHGQVNGTMARRSPGSTLKPFLYALAIDQGIIHPLSMLKDVSTRFGYYQPENFDGKFIGPLSAQDALIRSRNVPAVWLANQTQRPSLYQFLKQANISYLKPEEFYGLGIVLGGGEIKMTELASLYAMLATDGNIRPLRYTLNDSTDSGKQLLSPEAAFITRDMLRHNPRLDGLPQDVRENNWPVGWKTGTSWGYHDAWTAGVVGPYVLIVWVGNFHNQGTAHFIGIKSAAPLFFNIADALPHIQPEKVRFVDKAPEGVALIDVCVASGDLPNKWCPRTQKTWFIPGVSPIKVSTLHRPVRVDIQTGEAVCPPYNPETTKEEVFEFWPSDLRQLFASAGLPRRTPPPLAQNCLGTFMTAEAPQIRSPITYVTYTLRQSNPSDKIPLQARAASHVQWLYWFHEGRLLGQTRPGETLEWRPIQGGTIKLNVTDDHGQSAARTINVSFIQ